MNSNIHNFLFLLKKYEEYDRIMMVIFMKSPIGILDMGIENISILNLLQANFKYEHFIYVNDLECPNYEGLPEETIFNRVQDNVEFLMAKNVKLIIVVSNTILEYCYDYFNDIQVPVINIIDIITSFINDKYEFKNIALMAKESIIDANIYQKNLRYKHLYNINTDLLDEVINDNKFKTQLSFNLTKDTLKTVLSKDVDVIVPTYFNLLLFRTEIKEYMSSAIILELMNVFVDKITAALLAIENIYLKQKGKIEIYVNSDKINFYHLINKKIKVLKKGSK